MLFNIKINIILKGTFIGAFLMGKERDNMIKVKGKRK